jgi:hypothetical protein
VSRREGRLERCDYWRVAGWARDAEAPGERLRLILSFRGEKVAELTANVPRPSLKPLFGEIDYGFEYDWAVPVKPEDYDKISLRFADSGEPLSNSPADSKNEAPDWSRLQFADLCETPEDSLLPPLDRAACPLEDLNAVQRQWREEGVAVLPGFFEEARIDAYAEARWRLKPELGGWRCPVPYRHVPEIRALCLDPRLAEVLESLFGEPMGLHLNLTGWVSTERNWHQDDYLNPPFVSSWYAAVWIALEDIDPASGPFEYVPGSHRWPLLRREKVQALLPPHQSFRDDWPGLTQDLVARLCEEEIRRRGAKTRQFLARKGDLLIWHGRLLHRGSPPGDRNLTRKALIAHYSAIEHRPDFPKAERQADGGWLFPFDMPLD